MRVVFIVVEFLAKPNQDLIELDDASIRSAVHSFNIDVGITVKEFIQLILSEMLSITKHYLLVKHLIDGVEVQSRWFGESSTLNT
jgi:hypothetical protein